MHSEEEEIISYVANKQITPSGVNIISCCSNVVLFIDVFHKKLFYKPAMGSVIYHTTGKLSVDALYCIFKINLNCSVRRVYACTDTKYWYI